MRSKILPGVMQLEKLSYFRFWCQHIIPLVYDNSLSYYETLCKVCEKLNEVIEHLNSYSDDLENLIKQEFLKVQNQLLDEMNQYQQKVDAKLGTMQNQMDSLESSLQKQIADFTAEVSQQIKNQQTQYESDRTSLMNYVDNTVQNLQNTVNNQLSTQNAEFIAKVTELTNYVNGSIAALHTIVSNNLDLAKMYTDSEIQKLKDELIPLTTIYLRDPTTGRIEDAQTVIDNLYETLRYGALTAYEYDSLKLTAAKYDGYNLTAWQYDQEAKRYLVSQEENKDYAFSEQTGLYSTVQQNISELWQHNRIGGANAQELDATNFTCQIYDSMELDAYYLDNFQGNKNPKTTAVLIGAYGDNGPYSIVLEDNTLTFANYTLTNYTSVEGTSSLTGNKWYFYYQTVPTKLNEVLQNWPFLNEWDETPDNLGLQGIQGLSYIFQNTNLWPYITVKNNQYYIGILTEKVFSASPLERLLFNTTFKLYQGHFASGRVINGIN